MDAVENVLDIEIEGAGPSTVPPREPLKQDDPNYAGRNYSMTNRFSQLYGNGDGDGDQPGGPPARSGHRIVCTNDAMYLFGGYDPTPQSIQNRNVLAHESIYREVWRFDYGSRTFTKIDHTLMPQEVLSFAAAKFDNYVLLFGGTAVPFGLRNSNSLHVARIVEGKNDIQFLLQPTTGPVVPRKLYGQSIALDGKTLYVYGGTTGTEYSSDLFKLDLETNRWEQLYRHDMAGGNLPTPRYRQEMVFYNERLFVFGGGTVNSSFSLIKIPTFNTISRAWERVQTVGDTEMIEAGQYPRKRRCHGLAQDPVQRNLVFIMGGIDCITALGDTWRIDLDTMVWKHLTSMELPYGIYFHAMDIANNGRLTVFGGVTNRNNPCRRTSEVLVAWTRLAKLSSIAGDAISKYIKNGVVANITGRDLPRCLLAKVGGDESQLKSKSKPDASSSSPRPQND